MSLNQLQEIQKFPGWRSWLNSRVDDLNIYSQLNVEMDLAVTGDILEIGPSLEISWVPGGGVGGTTMDHMMAVANAFIFTSGVDSMVLFNNTSLIPSAHMSIINNGELLLTRAGVYMIMVNLNVATDDTTQNPSISLQRFDSATAQFLNVGDGLGVSAIIQPNYQQGEQSLCAMYPVLIASDHPSNNKFRILGSNPGSSVEIVSASSSLSVVKLS